MHFPLRSPQLRLSLLASSLLIAMSAQGREKVNVDLPAAPLGRPSTPLRSSLRYRSSLPAISVQAETRLR